ncbi:hypothetical protein ACEZDB_01880 [Streptacidiphilus sp. N1-3]|uniref:Uncharacterized protein n=1 Tax=Streptacidiphilus alkalitolerans TaxID=3342712 RepID=A0ABV6WTZ3_9ACTN
MVDDSLLNQVAHQLELAGLQAADFDEPQIGGFGIQPDNDGVWVVWTPSNNLSEIAFRQLAGGDRTHPIILHMGRVKHIMAEAMLRVLVSAGLNAKMSSDSMSPATIEVRPAEISGA